MVGDIKVSTQRDSKVCTNQNTNKENFLNLCEPVTSYVFNVLDFLIVQKPLYLKRIPLNKQIESSGHIDTVMVWLS